MSGGERASWGYRIGHFEKHYDGWAIWSDGVNYIARRKARGGLRGPLARGTTLDELAAAIDEAERHPPS